MISCLFCPSFLHWQQQDPRPRCRPHFVPSLYARSFRISKYRNWWKTVHSANTQKQIYKLSSVQLWSTSSRLYFLHDFKLGEKSNILNFAFFHIKICLEACQNSRLTIKIQYIYTVQLQSLQGKVIFLLYKIFTPSTLIRKTKNQSTCSLGS